MKKQIPLIIFLFAALFVVVAHIMLLLPVIAPSLTFSFADLSTLIGKTSGTLALQKIMYPYDSSGASFSLEYYRYGALPGTLFLFASLFSFTESWVWSIMTLFSLCIGMYGFYKLFIKEFSNVSGSLAAGALLLFYFLNFYAVGRAIHIYIWFGYLVTPYLISLAVDYFKTGNKRQLIALAIVFSQFFVFPHGLIYGALLIGLLSFSFISKSFLSRIKFLLAGALGYVVLNFQIFLSLFFQSTKYPVPANLSMFSLLSQHGSIQNTFSFVNNWWYMTDMSDTQNYQKIAMVLSAYFGIILLVLLIKSLYMRKRVQLASIILLAISVIVVVIASTGVNSPLVESLYHWLSQRHLLSSVLVFRESARILVILPGIFLIIAVLGFKRFDVKNILGLTLRRFLPFIMLLFLIFSPFVFSLLWKSYSPVEFPKTYTQLQSEILTNSKILWVEPQQKFETFGMPRLVWNTEKTPDMVEKSIGAQYGNISSMTIPTLNFLKNEVHTKVLLSDLLFNKIIVRNDYSSKDSPQVLTTGVSNPQSSNLFKVIPVLDQTINSRIAPSVVDFVENPLVWDILSKNSHHAIPIDLTASVEETPQIIELDNGYDVLTQSCKVSADCNGKVAYPYDSLEVHAPEDGWSKGTTSQLVQEPFIYYLQKKGISTYESDDFKGTAFTFKEGSKMDVTFDKVQAGKYKVYAKVLTSKLSGQLVFAYGGSNFTINTISEMPHFSWKLVGEITLSSQQSPFIQLTNELGINAIQEIDLIPTSFADAPARDSVNNTRIYVSYPDEKSTMLQGDYEILCQSKDVVLKLNKTNIDCSSNTAISLTDKTNISQQGGIVIFKSSNTQSTTASQYRSLVRVSPVLFSGRLGVYKKNEVLIISELFDLGWKAYATDSAGNRYLLPSVEAYDFMQGFTLNRENLVSIEITYNTGSSMSYVRFFSLVAPLIIILYWLSLYIKSDGSALNRKRKVKSKG